MLKHVVLKGSDGGVGECLAYNATFVRMGYFIDCALRVMGCARGFESPISCGLLYVCRTSVNVCLERAKTLVG